MLSTKILNNVKIPSLPLVSREGLALVYKPDVDIGKLAELFKKDAGVSSSVLKLANSSLFNLDKPTSDLKLAISRIGLSWVMQILISHSIESNFSINNNPIFNKKSFAIHNAFVGLIAHELAPKNIPNAKSDLLTAGLLHDIGLAAIASFEEFYFEKLVNCCVNEQIDFAQAEAMLNMKPHHEISAQILQHWNFPKRVQLLVGKHDINNHGARGELSDEEHTLVDILYLADILAHRFSFGYANYSHETRVDSALLFRVSLTSEEVMKAVEYVKSAVVNLS